ncbi:MAG: hypothetical protein ABII07_02940 [Patescibacteria group bacterium]|nr:hypothetical protein [Patescibacteria group bacterium]
MNESKKIREMPEPDERFFQKASGIGEAVEETTKDEFGRCIDFFIEKIQKALSDSQEPRAFVEAEIENLALQRKGDSIEAYRKRRIAGLENDSFGHNITAYVTREGRDNCVQQHDGIFFEDFEEFQDDIYMLKLPEGDYSGSSHFDSGDDEVLLMAKKYGEVLVDGSRYFHMGFHHVIRIEGEDKLWQNPAYTWSGELLHPEEIQEQEKWYDNYKRREKASKDWIESGDLP